jgi:hypothetical protein
MTTQELKNEFLIHYNAIASNSSPGLDDYEISVYLTKAQLELIKDYYDPLSNRKKTGFENTEKRRSDLKGLIKPFKTNVSTTNSNGLHSTSKFFTLSTDVFLIIYEQYQIVSTDCNNGRLIKVIPITHDDYNIQVNNPFKNPDDNTVWRLDASYDTKKTVVELISKFNTLSSPYYSGRYLKYPKPIIVGNLNTLFPSDGLTIDGLSAVTECELGEGIHREILDRSVELALRDYKPQGLEAFIQTNSRNE